MDTSEIVAAFDSLRALFGGVRLLREPVESGVAAPATLEVENAIVQIQSEVIAASFKSLRMLLRADVLHEHANGQGALAAAIDLQNSIAELQARLLDLRGLSSKRGHQRAESGVAIVSGDCLSARMPMHASTATAPIGVAPVRYP